MTTTHIAKPADNTAVWPRAGARASRPANVLLVRATGHGAELVLLLGAALLVIATVGAGLATANPWPAGVVALLLAAVAVRDRRVRWRFEGELATRALERDRLRHELERMGEELRWTRAASASVAERAVTARGQAAIASGSATAAPAFDAASLAHEVRGPLTGILAQAELALEELPAGSALRATLEPIRADALRAAAIMTAMLRRERRQPCAAGSGPGAGGSGSDAGAGGSGAHRTSLPAPVAHHQSLDLPTIADVLVARLGPRAARAGVRLEASVAPGPGPCVLSRRERLAELARTDLATLPVGCDPVAVTQILENLVTNAIAACPGGGRVRVASWLAADAAELRVIDDGIGMDPATLARAFDPGFTTRAGEGGHGLGLGISRRLAEGCGGSLTASSQAGRGTVVLLRLPVDRGARAADRAASVESLRSAA